MPIKKGPNDERSVEAEIIVPGTPEEVWSAIATGPGITAWFVPSTSDERAGGKATNNFGPGMEAVSEIKTWNPPHQFTAESEEGPGKVATEWTVEARDGNTCVVRVVHRWFTSSDQWDNEFEGHSYGWLSFFKILRIYLAHFAGQICAPVQLAAFPPKTSEEIWGLLYDTFDLAKESPAAIRRTESPLLGGVIEQFVRGQWAELIVRLDSPGPGVAHLFVMSNCGPTMLSIRFYFYGPEGPAAAALAEKQWSQWLAENFPSPK